ncbi:PerC family transcriptional regulator [Klebsiella aerogenes]|uniref:PerC family transcriptional regulator n=1 Tax=Klebsiella aerogenes TaxID=548 RepID=UPI0034D36D97
MQKTTPADRILLQDSIAEALERAGLWRRAAARWLHIFDQLESDQARERVALRREACLLMSTNKTEGDTGAKRRATYRKLMAAYQP